MSDGDWDATTPGGSKASGAAEAMYLFCAYCRLAQHGIRQNYHTPGAVHRRHAVGAGWNRAGRTDGNPGRQIQDTYGS